MAYVGYQQPQVLEERNIMWNGVAIRQNPIRVGQVEVDKAGHVVPTAKVQRQQVVTQIEDELFDLEGQRMRLHQSHALDASLRQPFIALELLEQIAPPQCFFRRLGLWN